MRTIAVLQPSYLPWLGYFDQIDRVDDFVFYDDVQFDKHGWRNRNRVKGAGGPVWLTVPVRHSGRFGQTILEAEVDNTHGWARKQIATLRQAYARAPFRDAYLPAVEALLGAGWRRLVDLDLALVRQMMAWFGIGTRLHLSSDLGIGGDKNQRLLSICRHFQANHYLSGAAAVDYLDQPAFATAGIAVTFQAYRHPAYPQLHGDFVSHLSALDLLLNCGPDSLAIIRQGREGQDRQP